MEYVLVTYQHDWADEHDVFGLTVAPKEEFLARFNKNKKALQKILDDRKINEYGYEESIEIYFGTNEAMTFDSVEEYERSYTINPISEQTYNELHKIFRYDWGKFFMNFDEYLEKTEWEN